MSDASNIREHMEVIGADGVHVGTVDHVEGDRIKLTKKDSGAEIEGAQGGHAGVQVLHQHQRRLGQGFRRPRQDEGHEVGRQRRDHPEAQRPGEGIAARPGGGGDIGRRADGTPRMGDDLLADRGGADLLAHALEDRHAKFLLQLEDLARQRRLGHVAGEGGLAEMAQFGDRDDVSEIPQVHEASGKLATPIK